MFVCRFQVCVALILLLTSACTHIKKSSDQPSLYCSKGVCLKVKSTDDLVTYTAYNSNEVPVMLTIRWAVQNGELLPEGVEKTFQMPLKKEVELAHIQRKDKSKPIKHLFRYWWRYGLSSAKHNDSYIYRVPLETGKSFKVMQANDGTFTHMDDSRYAVDLDVDEGTNVMAAREGVVIDFRSDSSKSGNDPCYKGTENYINILHSDGTIGSYVHLKKNGVVVKIGEWVQRGQLIGKSGNTGYSTEPHLHFAVLKSISGRSSQTVPVNYKTAQEDKTRLLFAEEYTAVD